MRKFLCVIALIFFTGCSKRQFVVEVTATPKRSNISINNKYVGEAPIEYRVNKTFTPSIFRKRAIKIEIEASCPDRIAQRKSIIFTPNSERVMKVHFDLEKDK